MTAFAARRAVTRQSRRAAETKADSGTPSLIWWHCPGRIVGAAAAEWACNSPADGTGSNGAFVTADTAHMMKTTDTALAAKLVVGKLSSKCVVSPISGITEWK